MKNFKSIIALLFSLYGAAASAVTPQQTFYEVKPDATYLQIGGFEFYLRLPLSSVRQAILFDNAIYLEKGRHIQTTLMGKAELMLDGDTTLTPADFVKLIFGLEAAKAGTSADQKFYKQAAQVKASLLKDKQAPLYGYQNIDERTVAFLYENASGTAFVIRKDNPDFFLQINAEGLSQDEFVAMIVKGALR